jgi:glycosyltransferase involved in cell wall biosynthesis
VISVIIPTVDRPGAAARLARALMRQTRRDFEIVVVDQSERPDPDLPDAIRIRERGLPNARNVGVRHARGDVLLFIDDDESPDDRWIECHARHYADPCVMGVAGRIRGAYDDAPGRVGRFGRWTLSIGRHFNADRPARVDHLPGGNFSIRREAFACAGGFDTAYGGAAVGEETDFSLRLRASRPDGVLVYDPEAAVTHRHMATGGCRETRFSRWLYWHAHNVMLLALRHAARPALPLIVLARALRFGLFALEHRDPALVAVGLLGLGRGVSSHLRTRER